MSSNKLIGHTHNLTQWTANGWVMSEIYADRSCSYTGFTFTRGLDRCSNVISCGPERPESCCDVSENGASFSVPENSLYRYVIYRYPFVRAFKRRLFKGSDATHHFFCLLQIDVALKITIRSKFNSYISKIQWSNFILNWWVQENKALVVDLRAFMLIIRYEWNI
jgi:hypothetical protein